MNRRLLFVICIIFAIAAPTAHAFQQASPAASPAASPIASPAASPEASPVAAEVTPEGIGNFHSLTARGTVSDLGYGDLTTPGGQSVIEYFLPLPPGVNPDTGAGMTLVYSHSPLLRPDVSTMTVSVNGVAAASVFLDDTNLERAELEVSFPESSFNSNGFLVQVAFSMRLSVDVCEDVDNVGLWSTIHSDSSYAIPYLHFIGDADLETLPQQFIGGSSPLTIVVPDNASPAEIDAAGAIAARIGEWNAQRPDIATIVTAPPSNTVEGPAIYIGTGDRLRTPFNWTGLVWDGEIYNSSNGPVAPDHGVIALLQQPYPALLVSGATDQALARAVTAVTDDRYIDLLTGPYRVITGEEPTTEATSPWSKPTVTFGDLGFEHRTIRGESTSGIDLAFSRPAEWVAGNGGTLNLVIESSPALVEDSSWIAVTVNDVPVGSQRIVASETPVTYQFQLDADTINALLATQAPNTLHLWIEFNLQVERGECQAVDPMDAWATLLEESSIGIPHALYHSVDLARLPAPMLLTDADAPYIIAVPDATRADDLATALQLAFAFGMRTSDVHTGIPMIRSASDLTENDLARTSIVAIGTADTNAILADTDIAAALPPVSSQSDAAQLMQVAIVPSPWSEELAIVAIIPPGGDLAVAQDLFADPLTFGRLTGTSSSIDADLNVTQTGAAEVPVLPPDATPVIAGEIAQVPTEETGIAPEPTTEPTEEPAADIDPTEAPSIVAETDADDDDDGELEAWQVAGAIILGGIVVGIGAFLWIRLAGRNDIP